MFHWRNGHIDVFKTKPQKPRIQRHLHSFIARDRRRERVREREREQKRQEKFKYSILWNYKLGLNEMLMIFIALLLANIFFFEYRNKGCNFSECLLANKSFVMRSHNSHTKKRKKNHEHHISCHSNFSVFISLPCSKAYRPKIMCKTFTEITTTGRNSTRQNQKREKKTTHSSRFGLDLLLFVPLCRFVFSEVIKYTILLVESIF